MNENDLQRVMTLLNKFDILVRYIIRDVIAYNEGMTDYRREILDSKVDIVNYLRELDNK